MVIYQSKGFKDVLNRHKFIDSWFWDRFSINPYSGCEYACTYCDSRSHRYHLHPEFSHVIFVKSGVADALKKRLKGARKLLPDVVCMSGTCDPYQPAEGRFKNTRGCLEVLLHYRYPVHIITKSPLVLRDKDLLSELSKEVWCTVSVTITNVGKEKVLDFLEPNAPSPKERFKIIKELKECGIQTGVLLIPIVPFLCDGEEMLCEVVEGAKEVGADYVLFSAGMTMRDNQALWFMRSLMRQFPEFVHGYEELYGFRYDPDLYTGSYAPKREYSLSVQRKVFDLCERYGLQYRIKRFIPQDFRRMNYLIAEELLNEAYRLQIAGEKWSGLHWAGLNIQNLTESIVDVAKRGGLRQIKNVGPKTESLILARLYNHTKDEEFT